MKMGVYLRIAGTANRKTKILGKLVFHYEKVPGVGSLVGYFLNKKKFSVRNKVSVEIPFVKINMYRFTGEEIADMHLLYGFCNCNSSAAAREYRRRYPNRTQPDRRFFTRIHMELPRFINRSIRRERSVSSHTDGLQEIVVNLVRNNPEMSTRRIAVRLGTSHTTIHRILQRHRMHPYHYTAVQDVLHSDHQQRLDFCRLILQSADENRHFLSSILWTDEAQFTRDGVTNFHNLHQWADSNPRVTRSRSFQRRFSFNVWAGVINQTLIGPFFLPDILNAEIYKDFLASILPDILDEIPLAFRSNVIFQQDGAPAHYGREVRQWLSANFNRWIGRGGTINWPPRSPDLTPMDFYVWGTMKDHVYARPIQTPEQLRGLILEAGEKIRTNLQNINLCHAIRRRYSLCVRQEGGLIEHLL